jgi:ABC-type antimicrobial peptide transport system permease subunit
LIGPVHEAVAAVDPTQLPYNVKTMSEVVTGAAGPEWRWMRLLGLCAGLALSLAAVGIFGVVSQTVSKRTREIGIRVALGADRQRVLAMVVRRGMLPVLVGTVLGAAAALALTRFMASLLFEVTPTDGPTFAAAIMVLTAVTSVACYLPARRALRIQPVMALKED